eukprot:TRINITY_DN57625_c0_g1_i1.p1 TRINITY_DN57625_c0_g1~~TRINITY_DN57625_c0_g1_i1.p1  ORF type:complete len:173 (-),score=23.57 TRINITY_DN57625_c0_g1_i1:29-547(-)
MAGQTTQCCQIGAKSTQKRVMLSAASVSDLVLRDDWKTISRFCLDGWRENTVWSPQQLFSAALAVEAMEVMSGLFGSLTMAGRIDEVLRMQDIARARKPEIASKVIQMARLRTKKIISRRHRALADLQLALASESSNVERLNEVYSRAIKVGLSPMDMDLEKCAAVINCLCD